MKDLRFSPRRVLNAAAVTGVAGAVIGATVVFAKHHKQLGPFSSWSEPINLGPVVVSTSNDFHSGISELSIYFTSDRPGRVNGANLIPVTELWVTQRDEPDATWEQPLNLGPRINSFGYSNGVPNLPANGHWLFFGSSRPGGCSAPSPNCNTDLWVARRTQGGEI
jgi:hypothetical protein